MRSGFGMLLNNRGLDASLSHSETTPPSTVETSQEANSELFDRAYDQLENERESCYLIQEYVEIVRIVARKKMTTTDEAGLESLDRYATAFAVAAESMSRVGKRLSKREFILIRIFFALWQFIHPWLEAVAFWRGY